MRPTITVTGGEAIAKKLEQTRDRLVRRHLAGALKAGAEVIHAEAVRRAPEGETGNLKEDIKVRRERNPPDAPIAFSVRNTGETFYARFVEFGHAIVPPGQRRMFRTTVKLGKDWSGGYVAPRPFMRPAWDTKREEAQARIAAELRRRLKLK